MSIGQIIVLAAIVGAFVLFAAIGLGRLSRPGAGAPHPRSRPPEGNGDGRICNGLEEGRQERSRRVRDCPSALAAAVGRPTAARGVI